MLRKGSEMSRNASFNVTYIKSGCNMTHPKDTMTYIAEGTVVKWNHKCVPALAFYLCLVYIPVKKQKKKISF